jgi:hypothetical protein
LKITPKDINHEPTRTHPTRYRVDRRRRCLLACNLLRPDFLFLTLKGNTMETITTTPAELARAVDEIANIRAQIAELKAQEETRRLFLIMSGHTAIDGELHRATISTTYKVSIDWKTIAERLNPSPQLITAHTHKADEPTHTLRLSGRKVAR